MPQNRGQEYSYFDRLRDLKNFSNQFKLSIEKLNNTIVMIDEDDIRNICSDMARYIKDDFCGLKLERQTTVTITTFNILLRIYAYDEANKISACEEFQDLSKACISQIDAIQTNEDSYKNCAEEMLNLVLMNFVNDNLINKYLDQFYGNKSEITSNFASFFFL